MAVRIIGEHPLARNGHGQLVSSVATLFTNNRDLVTLRGVHATQRVAYVEYLNRQRDAQGLLPLTSEESFAEWDRSVDLIVDGERILIRPDPEQMDLAFEADEILQDLVSKPRIQFLNATDERVRDAIRRRGEYWRITALPRSSQEMKEMIQRSRIRIHEQPIYYYNMITGTRLITYGTFAGLEALDEEALARQLQEIRSFSADRNRACYLEVDFFAPGNAFGAADFAPFDFSTIPPAEVRPIYLALKQKFMSATPPELRADDPQNLEWRNRMFTALIRRRDEILSEEILRGLSPEFYLQIQWIPGGRIEGGELLFDPVFEEYNLRPDDPGLASLCDPNARSFFFNFIREFGDVEYVNIGRIVGSLGVRPPGGGRRDVYIAEIKLSGVEKPVVRVIRMQKWGVRERLEENKDLLRSMMESEEYTEYILDRRLGCRQLGMNIPARVTTGRIGEIYRGWRRDFYGRMFWATYFERDYIAGMATDKIPPQRYANRAFVECFAHLLGAAAASNVIVGRQHLDGRVLFDDGDEVLLLDDQGLPREIVVADHTGTFMDFRKPLDSFAEQYARPVNQRAPFLEDPAAFAGLYLEAFVRRFDAIQREYRRKKLGFDSLFKHHKHDDEGCFAYRWERVLDRLNQTDAQSLAQAIGSRFVLPAAPREETT